MVDIKELLAQKEALERRIDDAKREQREQAVAQVRELMAQYGLTAADVIDRRPAKAPRTKASGSTGKVAPKYRDPQTGDTWSGRGLQPRWLKAALAQGRKVDDFKV
jgi:DNA-binding protein H-NS